MWNKIFDNDCNHGHDTSTPYTRAVRQTNRRTDTHHDDTALCTTSIARLKPTDKHFSSRPPSSSYLSPHCLQCYNRPESHSSQTWRLKRVSRLFITRTSQAEHTVDHSHEINTFQHGLECLMPIDALAYCRTPSLWLVVYLLYNKLYEKSTTNRSNGVRHIIHSRPWRNVSML